VQGFPQGAFAISEDVAWEDDVPRGIVRLGVCLNAHAGRCPTASNLAAVISEFLPPSNKVDLY
jgi:hypothetical protein